MYIISQPQLRAPLSVQCRERPQACLWSSPNGGAFVTKYQRCAMVKTEQQKTAYLPDGTFSLVDYSSSLCSPGLRGQLFGGQIWHHAIQACPHQLCILSPLSNPGLPVQAPVAVDTKGTHSPNTSIDMTQRKGAVIRGGTTIGRFLRPVYRHWQPRLSWRRMLARHQ